jgi:hypothetical protein
MPTIAMRKIDVNHDPIAGTGTNAFVYDLDAIAQLIQTRLLMFTGEWWKNLIDGLPLFQKILGIGGAGRASDIVSGTIQNRIELTPYVIELQNVSTTYQSTARAFNFSCTVVTAFGNLQVCVGPGSQASVSGSAY